MRQPMQCDRHGVGRNKTGLQIKNGMGVALQLADKQFFFHIQVKQC